MKNDLLQVLWAICQELSKLNEALTVLRKEQSKTATIQLLKEEQAEFKRLSMENTRKNAHKLDGI